MLFTITQSLCGLGKKACFFRHHKKHAFLLLRATGARDASAHSAGILYTVYQYFVVFGILYTRCQPISSNAL